MIANGKRVDSSEQGCGGEVHPRPVSGEEPEGGPQADSREQMIDVHASAVNPTALVLHALVGAQATATQAAM
jgi:hypothetical protein